MANEDHVRRLKDGAEWWNRWRQKAPEIRPDLGRADFRNWDLGSANLTWANLREAILIRADLRGADLARADLGDTYLSGADFRRANLHEAILTRADLSRADLSEAHLHGANLSGADLSEAHLNWANLNSANLNAANLARASFSRAGFSDTVLADVDLRAIKGLENVRHRGPSYISIDTLYKSKGEIPDVFLRGCGVPEDMIAFIHSIRGAIQFYSCFISYSTKDQDFADRLHSDLQNNAVRCWFAPHDVKAGRKLHEQIDEAIRLHDKLLLILSPDSMNSEWVKTEIAKARKREVRDNCRVLFPIRLCRFEQLRDWECFDADTGKDLAKEIREYFVPDFSNWKDHDPYQKAFTDLLRDLKPAATASA